MLLEFIYAWVSGFLEHGLQTVLCQGHHIKKLLKLLLVKDTTNSQDQLSTVQLFFFLSQNTHKDFQNGALKIS